MSISVNHPQHYQSKSGLEAIDVIEAFELDFHLGNAIKYILRAGKKDSAIQDIEKAMWYLARHINTLEVDYEKEMDSGCDKAQGCAQRVFGCEKRAKDSCCKAKKSRA